MANIFKSLARAATPFLGNIPIVGGLLQNAAQDIWRQEDTTQAYNQNLSYQKNLMSTQNQYNIDMFNRQLEANKSSIIDQYRQYQELGINPLMLNGGVQQTNMAGAPASSIPAPFEPVSSLQSAQIDLMRSESAKNRAEANAIDPEEARSRTRLNNVQAEYTTQLSTTEQGMRKYKILDAQNICNLTVVKAELTKRESEYYRDLRSLLSEQINETNQHAGLLLEQQRTEVFNRQQAEIMNKATREHWNKQDKAALINANANAANVSLAMQRWETEKGLYENQAEYWKQFAENLKKDGKLKDCEITWQENTLDMRFQAFGAEWLYHITEMEDGTKRIQLDLEYLNKHGGLLLKRQFAEDMNAYICGYFTPARINASYGTKVAGAAAGAKFFGGAASSVNPPALPSYPSTEKWY